MYVSPESLRLLDELVSKDALELRDWYFGWVLFCAAVVVLGVVLEGPEVVHESLELFRNGDFPESHSSPAKWVKWTALIGWILVSLGVAGELVFEGLTSSAEKKAAAFSDILLADTRERTSRTEATAKGFELQIASARVDVAQARASAESARALARGYDAQIASLDAASRNAVIVVKTADARIAEAEARAAEARSMAEAERLERVRLEAIVAPRTLNLEEQRLIAAACKPFASRHLGPVTK